jgi:Subtilase family
MPDQTRSHLRISPERIRQERFAPQVGGASFTRDDYDQHADHLLTVYQGIFKEVQDLNDARYIFLQIELHQDRTIPSERQHLEKLGFQLVSVSPDARNVGIARISRARFYGLEGRLAKYANTRTHKGRSYFAPIEDIRRVPVSETMPDEVIATTGDYGDYLISMHPSLPISAQEALAGQIVRQLLSVPAESAAELEIADVRIRRYADGVVAIAATLRIEQIRMLIEQFSSIALVESNAAFVSEESTPAVPLPPVILIGQPKCSETVVVIDSGVNPASNLLRDMVVETLSFLPDFSVAPHWDHGTFVASRIVYGDEIIQALSSRIDPWCRIIDVRVTGVDATGKKILPRPDGLAATIQQIVPELAQRARVFNISLGQGPIVTRQFSRIAALLDHLARQFGVLFIVSAGNINPEAPPPAHFVPESARTKSPGEALLALTIGSVAKTADANCAACIQGVSPFSCRGPGADNGYKPEIVAHGGNASFDGANWRTSFQVGVHGISQDGQSLAFGCGTSFSAPIVAQYAARLFDAYPDIGSNMVRALLCHFTESVIAPPNCPLAPHTLYGFGEPSMDRALFATRSSASYLYEGHITSEYAQFIPSTSRKRLLPSRSIFWSVLPWLLIHLWISATLVSIRRHD